ncbi:sodium/proton antiporter, CPA1 family (TC 2.A.36) [Chthonomonas calidirosea]|uniref:Sodium/proton antiporter, CPA1 family (TC 2.A.36) n=1 Tax=Chthonomonas calidirosea (strain DSM 23976 / ICMP 18418 / T49) TaxID=1303518 RepID=S0EZI8_CHTCT|nr:cation:proton antiporter [Chthonomonas calidirosea]CCW36309.1 sodium/proton antiporter, CPA1 family (TC 2.A.36) [Chthonomonas calidirosea T49]CEK17711.1 sodium/proton antiporter, CPA1 family (TC 2.A.36) [Chthonomonas calidirosea]
MSGPFDPNLFLPLFLIAVFVALIARKLQIPYAVALVGAGLVVGFSHLLPRARLDAHVLLTLFLPPLLFKTALLLNYQDLKKNALPIVIYTLGACLFSALVVTIGVAWALAIPLKVAFVFGALISATDPIAVIALFQKLGAPARLTLLIESESLFNDGIAAVLFTLATQTALGRHPTPVGIGQHFAILLLGGVGIGGLIGLLASLFHRHVDDHLLELMLTTVTAFGSYLVADRLHASGVVSVVTTGLIVGHIGCEAMSATTKEAVYAFWEYAEFVVNSLVFLLIGAELASLPWFSLWKAALVAAALVIVGRLSVYPLSFLANRLNASVPLRWQPILWWGGLRGALSMALVLSLAPRFPFRPQLIAMTFGTVAVSILLQGLTMAPLLHRLLSKEEQLAPPTPAHRPS